MHDLVRFDHNFLVPLVRIISVTTENLIHAHGLINPIYQITYIFHFLMGQGRPGVPGRAGFKGQKVNPKDPKFPND